jgi:DNA-binding NtrC family response regulator
LRALLRANRSDDELAQALARAGLYVERVTAERAPDRLESPDVAVVDPRLLGATPVVALPPPAPVEPEGDRSLEEICYSRFSAVLERLGDERLPGLHATAIDEVERGLLRAALDRAGTIAAAAELLGLHRNTLSRRLEELGLRRRESRTPAARPRRK